MRNRIWLYLASHSLLCSLRYPNFPLRNSRIPKCQFPELYDTAVLLFKAAAAKDYAPAQNELAKIYRDGLWGITPDPKRLLKLFETAATPNSDAVAHTRGLCSAQFNLAEMYKAKMYKDPTSQPKDSKENGEVRGRNPEMVY